MMQPADLWDVTPDGVFGSHDTNRRENTKRSGRCARAEQRRESILIAPCEKDFHSDHNKCDCQSAGGQKQMKKQNVNHDWSEDDQRKRNRDSQLARARRR